MHKARNYGLQEIEHYCVLYYHPMHTHVQQA